jgi:glycosyltransferase involved in cell wall biosynthesis
MGVPVVASDVPGPADAMRHEVTGLMVPVKDAGALAEALQVLLRDPVKRAAYGAAAATFARDGFEQKKYLQYVLADKEQLITREGLV